MEDEGGTRIIQDLDTTKYLKEAQAFLDKRLAQNPNVKPLFLHRNHPVYNFGDGEKGSYIILPNAQGKVEYFVKYKRISHNKFSLGRQVLLVRDPNSSDLTNGFAQRIFFDVLLKKYGSLVADQQQTKKGQAFWGNAIESAWSRNLYVYMLDRRSRNTQLVPIPDRQTLDDLASTLWGTSRAHELVFAVISTKPLELHK